MSTTPRAKETRTNGSFVSSLDKLIRSTSAGMIDEPKQSKVLIIQNDLLCSPCTAIASLIEYDVTYQVLYAFHDHAFKLIHPLMYDAMIVLGGRAGVYEANEIKWLKNEMIFITKAIQLRIPILGKQYIQYIFISKSLYYICIQINILYYI